MTDTTDPREDRFSALYESSRSRVVAYVLRRTSSREDAADVVAEIFEIAWRRLNEIPQGEAALLWLYVTARNVLANHYRRVQRRKRIVVRLAEELGSLPAHRDAADEDGLVMRSCLGVLSEDDREILMLSAWEGLSAAEIGRVLGCSATAGRIRLHRARSRLQAQMNDHAVTLSKRSERVGHIQGTTATERDLHQEALEP